MDLSVVKILQLDGTRSQFFELDLSDAITKINSVTIKNDATIPLGLFFDRNPGGNPDFTVPALAFVTVPIQPSLRLFIAPTAAGGASTAYVLATSAKLAPGLNQIAAVPGLANDPNANPAPGSVLGSNVNSITEMLDKSSGKLVIWRGDNIGGSPGIGCVTVYGTNGLVYSNNFSDLQGRRLTSFGDGSIGFLQWAVGQVISQDGKVRGIIGRAEISASPDADNYNVQLVATGALRFDIAAGTVANTSLKTKAGRLCRVLVIASGANAMQFTDDNNTGAGPIIGIIAANESVGTVIDFEMPANFGITAVGNAGNPQVAVSIH